MPYTAPIDQISQTLRHVARIDDLVATGAFPAFDAELIDPILEEAGKLARDVLAPLNAAGHKAGAKLTDQGVAAAPGFADAYGQFRDGGWMSLPFPEQWGGQGLPRVMAIAMMEMMQAANAAFALCPMLSFGAIEALLAHGTDEQKAMYLPNLVSGTWTGTMNLTEPHAGSDVGALKTKAVPNSDGSYAISGQKIFITWGDHDAAPNIIHLVLARLPDAPAGSKGVSLFLCPKYLLNADGSPGQRNGVRCIGLEHKIGIHASPTCVMEYDNAKAWLLGGPNKGLAAMFTMMNSARLQVGLQGVAISEAARQTALAYAQDRKQGMAPGVEGYAPIIHHPDVQRMLAAMTTATQAARAICYACASAADMAEHAADPEARKAAKLREELLTPLAKAWSTDCANMVSSLGVQIHGGMGFMNETMAAQHFLDARIGAIYEGTNGIQAIDLVGRKLSMENGAAMQALLADIRDTAREARASNEPRLVTVADRLEIGAEALAAATAWITATMKSDRETALAGATTYQRLAGDVTGGWLLALGALGELRADGPQRERAISLARYFAEETLTQAPARLTEISSAAPALKADSAALLGV